MNGALEPGQPQEGVNFEKKTWGHRLRKLRGLLTISFFQADFQVSLLSTERAGSVNEVCVLKTLCILLSRAAAPREDRFRPVYTPAHLPLLALSKPEADMPPRAPGTPHSRLFSTLTRYTQTATPCTLHPTTPFSPTSTDNKRINNKKPRLNILRKNTTARKKFGSKYVEF